MLNKSSVPRMETINEAAKLVGLAKYHIRQMVLHNKVKYVKAGKKYLINLDSLVEYLNTGDTTAKVSNPNHSSVRGDMIYIPTNKFNVVSIHAPV